MNNEITINSDSKLADFLDSPERLGQYLMYKAKHHRHFKWYTRQEFIESDLSNDCIIINDGNNWNDTFDKKSFNSIDGVTRFGLCLSYSKSESVAMWMLYGGMGKTGAMIDFPLKFINEILKTKVIELGVIDADTGSFKKLQELKDDQFSISLVDVIYVAEQEDGYYTIKKSDKTEENVEANVIDSYNGIKKNFPWNYETECRLIVEVKNDVISPSAKGADNIKIHIDSFKDKVDGRIFHAPNYDSSSKGYKFKKSNLNGEINWDLCLRCTKTK